MICVDSSVVVQWLLPEPFSQQALALVATALQAVDELIAPPLIGYEVTNALWKQVTRNNLAAADAEWLLNRFLRLPITLVSPPVMHREALKLALRHGLRASYDAHYLILAQRFGCEFWTADATLYNTVHQAMPFVRSLAAYPLPSPSSTI